MNSREVFCKNLKYQMEKQDISVKNLASCVGVSEQTLKSYMSQKTAPRLSIFIKICLALGVTPDYILGVADESHYALK